MSQEQRDQRMPVMLPNSDIYLGPKPGGRPDNISGAPAPEAQNAGEAALAEALDNATHQEGQAKISCPWCGQVQEGAEVFKTHIKTQHASMLGDGAEKERRAQEEQEAALDYARQELGHADGQVEGLESD